MTLPNAPKLTATDKAALRYVRTTAAAKALVAAGLLVATVVMFLVSFRAANLGLGFVARTAIRDLFPVLLGLVAGAAALAGWRAGSTQPASIAQALDRELLFWQTAGIGVAGFWLFGCGGFAWFLLVG